MLGPAQGIENRHGLARFRARGDLFPDLAHAVHRHATDLTGQLRRVAAVVLLHQLEHTTRVLQGRVDLGKTVFTDFIAPAGLIGVIALGCVVAAEQAVLEAVALFDDERHVGVIAHVLVLNLVSADQVIDQAAHEGDIRTGTNWRVIIGHRCSSGKTRVDHDQPSLVMGFGLGYPFEATRMGLCSVATHHQDQIRVSDIGPVVGHGTTAVRRGKTCHRRAVSDTRLVIKPQHAKTANNLVGHVAGFVGRS
ncbi:hypothetical protein D3C81_753050 [compost metagenome]